MHARDDRKVCHWVISGGSIAPSGGTMKVHWDLARRELENKQLLHKDLLLPSLVKSISEPQKKSSWLRSTGASLQ